MDVSPRDLKIVVIDDSAVVREQLSTVLPTLESCRLIGMAATGEYGVEMTRSLSPDLIVLDPSMRQTNGIDVLREIRRHDLRVIVVVFTLDYSEAMRDVCRNAGATFFLNKARPGDLLDVCAIVCKFS